jgi:hypothetical protein
LNRTLSDNLPPKRLNRNTQPSTFLTPCAVFSGAWTGRRGNVCHFAVPEIGNKGGRCPTHKHRPPDPKTPYGRHSQIRSFSHDNRA